MSLWDPVQVEVEPTERKQAQDDLIILDNQMERSLEQDTRDLLSVAQFSTHLSKAAFEVAKYIPPHDDANSDFWREKVIPALSQAMVTDLRAKNALVHTMSLVRDLATTIKTCGEIVRDTKGSPKSIEIAREKIPRALQALNEAAEAANTLENVALELFKEHADKFMQIIGEEAADFVKRKMQLQSELVPLEKEKQDLLDEMSQCKGEMEKYNNLLTACDMRVRGAGLALEDTKGRTSMMNQLNDEAELAIKKIPVYHSRSKIFQVIFFKTVTETEPFDNPDREAQKKYYESAITARAARIQQNEQAMTQKDLQLAALQKEYAELKGKYTIADLKYKSTLEQFPKRFADIQAKIDSKVKQIDQLNDSSHSTSNNIGLTGNLLIDCLVSIRAFTASQHQSAQMYAPLVSILKGIIAIVDADVELLSGDDTNIFLAGNRLLAHVGKLTKYATNTRQQLGQLCVPASSAPATTQLRLT